MHIELLSFKRGDFERQDLSDLFKKGVCDVEVNFNICMVCEKISSNAGASEDYCVVVCDAV
jgi:hypothetical protein